jgi:protein TonB
MKKLILFYEKLLSFCFIIFSYFLPQKKVYYTEDFKELSTAEGAAYYSTYENDKEGTTRHLFY